MKFDLFWYCIFWKVVDTLSKQLYSTNTHEATSMLSLPHIDRSKNCFIFLTRIKTSINSKLTIFVGQKNEKQYRVLTYIYYLKNKTKISYQYITNTGCWICTYLHFKI